MKQTYRGIEGAAPPPETRVAKGRHTGLYITLALLLAVAVVGAGIAGLVTFRDNNKMYYLPSSSMIPTLHVDDSVRTHKISATSTVPRGWIVIFSSPPKETDPAVKVLIKRVVGLPGETIEARDGVVYVNGAKLDEPYLGPGDVTTDLPKTVVPAGTYYVMGDNRQNSADSRFFGPIPRSTIQRHVVSIELPVNRRRSLP